MINNNKKNFYMIMLHLSMMQHIPFIHSITQVYFTPRDNIKQHLLELIRSETKAIYGAIYMFTDKMIAEELVHAHVKGVKITLIVDQASMDKKLGKGAWLQSNGISLFVFESESKNPFITPLMHHKFFIFEHNTAYTHKKIVWTGSFNCTQSASIHNHENVLVSDDKTVFDQYMQCFQNLFKIVTKK